VVPEPTVEARTKIDEAQAIEEGVEKQAVVSTSSIITNRLERTDLLRIIRLSSMK
jgi:hypothetical protein